MHPIHATSGVKPNILIPKRDYLPLSEGFVFDEILGLKRTKPVVWIDTIVADNRFPLPVHRVTDVPWFHSKERVDLLRSLGKKTDARMVYFEFGYDAYRFLKDIRDPPQLPIIVSLRGADTSVCVEKYGFDYSAIASFVTCFLVRSDEMRKRMIALDVPSEKIRIHHTGINISRFPIADRSVRTPGLILCCCRFVEKKGIDDLLRAVALIRSSLKNKLTLLIVGKGPLLNTYMRMIDELSIRDRVIVRGPADRTEVPKLLRSADVLVQVSRTSSAGDMEGIPVILMEAMCSGIPVIATKHAGIPELVRRPEWGTLVEPGDILSLKSAIEEYLGEPELCELDRSDARTHVLSEFNATIQCSKIDDLFLRNTENESQLGCHAN